MFHPEDVPSAKERYKEQAVRVVQVLDKILEGKEYLVGDKWYVIFPHPISSFQLLTQPSSAPMPIWPSFLGTPSSPSSATPG